MASMECYFIFVATPDTC